ncbi:MAG: hypothetical protein IPQ03_11700 [Bacteroidetes bacterium]|nr:hypothetical protein [Bacteroidota bacterium]
MDVITTAIYCGLPQNGNWYVALTGDGTDAFSMKLTSPLIAGSNYILTFYDHGCGSPYSTGPCPVQIGTSATNNSMGTIVGTMPVPNPGIWTQRTLVFTAPPNANYITIQLVGGGLQNWTQVDNFVISQQSLPIELTSFMVFRDNDYNHLEWTTASELNNDYFDLENSTDGMQFKHLATINGSGNSTELRMYTYNDYFPINGTITTVFVRLITMEFFIFTYCLKSE